MSESFPFQSFCKASTREVERKGDGVCSCLPEGTIRVLRTAKETLSSLINRLGDMYNSFCRACGLWTICRFVSPWVAHVSISDMCTAQRSMLRLHSLTALLSMDMDEWPSLPCSFFIAISYPSTVWDGQVYFGENVWASVLRIKIWPVLDLRDKF